MNVTGIILAGGKSSRMGSDKGLVEINGKPMISHVISSMKNAGIKDIVIIANNSEYKQFGFPVFPDIIKEKGPLGGIYTGLTKSKTVKNLILSCDIPFIDEKVLRLLIAGLDKELITVIKNKEHIHHLIGVYDSSLIASLGEHLLENKLKVEHFNSLHSRKIIDLEEFIPEMTNIILSNINTMEELKMKEHGM